MATELPEKPESREESYLADIAGQEVELPEKPLSRKEQYLAYIAENGGGGGGGTSNFNQLTNRPKYDNATMTGNTSIPKVPTKTSELSNDSNFVTSSDLPTVNDATLTITQNGTSKGTFTANDSDDVTVELADTTYSNFTGTDGTAVGVAGLVPAPATTDARKFLGASGLWETIQSGSGITELTTADYNYPADNPTYVALWLLEPGVYWRASNSVEVRTRTQTAGKTEVSSMNIFIISGDITTSHSMMAISNSSVKTTVLSANGGGTTGFPKTYLIEDSVVDNLTSTSTTTPLSANQGKVLKDLVDSLAVRGAGAPTTSTVGSVGTLYEDTTNGKLYICTDATNPYVWEEVGAGGSGASVVTLTSADYDYPTDNPTRVAVWMLADGVYSAPSADLAISTSTNVGYGYRLIKAGNTIFTWSNAGENKIYIVSSSNGSQSAVYDLAPPTVSQTTGTSTTDVMSQNAVTSMVYADPSTRNKVQIGNNSTVSSNTNGGVAIGKGSSSSSGAIAFGNGWNSFNVAGAGAIGIGSGSVNARGAISLGAFCATNETQGVMQIGTTDTNYGYNSSNYRLLTGLYDPQSAHDAATKGYVDGITTTNAGAPTTATVGTVGQLLEDTTNGKLYICTAVTPGTDPDPDTYTWVEVGAGGGGTGAVVELTTDDYDYTYGSTSGVALWRLEAGLYHTANDVQAYAGSGSNDFKLSLKSHLIIIDDDGNRKLIKVVGDSFSASSSGVYKGFVEYNVAASGGSGSLAQSESVISTASLMRKIGSTPTSSDIGFKGQLWYDSANNKLYINVNAPSDYAGNWKEISLAS